MGAVVTVPLILDRGNLAQQIAARTAQPGARLAVGVVTAVDSAGNATVNTRGGARSGLLTLAPVATGDSVLIATQDGVSWILGPAAQSLPTSGTVSAVPTNSYTVPVATASGTISAAFTAAYTPTVNDTVLLAWVGSQAVILGKRGQTGAPSGSSSGAPTPAPGAPPAAPTSGTSVFPAVDSGSYRASTGGWRTDANGNVIQYEYSSEGISDGAWFYGGRIHSTLAGCAVVSAAIWLARAQGGVFAAQPAHITRITNDVRPAGDVTFDAGNEWDIDLAVGQSGWFVLPNSFGQALIDSGGSIGIRGVAPYMRLYGLPNSGMAGAVQIAWQRSS